MIVTTTLIVILIQFYFLILKATVHTIPYKQTVGPCIIYSVRFSFDRIAIVFPLKKSEGYSCDYNSKVPWT